MKVVLKKFQAGGTAPAPASTGSPEPAPTGAAQQGGEGQDPLMMLAQMAAEALQSGDCNSMAQVCEGFLTLIQQAAGGGEGEPAPQGEPVFKKGGTIVRRISK